MLVVALVVAVVWRVARSDDDGDGERSSFPTVEPAEAPSERTGDFARRPYDTGDCVVWDQGAGFKETRVVPCEEPHLAEITGRSDLPPDQVPYPTDADWERMVAEHCRPLGVDHLGHELDPYGQVGPYLLHPSPQGWDEGDRVLWCGLVLDDRGSLEDRFASFTGRIADVDQAIVDPPGTCLLEDARTRVDCAAAHHFEVVSELDLSALSERPSDDEIFDRCPPVPPGTTAPAGGEVQVTFLGFDPDSWGAGTRRGMCAVAAFGTDEEPIAQTGRMVGD